MATISIPLGDADKLKVLYSYPNIPGTEDRESLADTILHWLGQTLTRDGLDAGMATVRTEGSGYCLDLDGPSPEQCDKYKERLPKILHAGWDAYAKRVSKLKEVGKWDPDQTGQWRFFLTHGVGLVEHRSLQFFHYPPIRLLDPLRDSMNDPVTFRCRDLLMANGVEQGETQYYETRINSTPIAAPDDQGSGDSPHADPVWGGLIPVEFFLDFQKTMIETLIQPGPVPGYTVPMVVYGKNPRQMFGGLFLLSNKAEILEVVPGKKTPVLGSNHPYRFYYTAQEAGQTEAKVGSGKLLPQNCKKSIEIMKEDLAVVRWQVKMAEDPSRDPWAVNAESKEFWNKPEQERMVCALVRRHGSLFYKDPEGLEFRFNLELDDTLGHCDMNGNNPCG